MVVVVLLQCVVPCQVRNREEVGEGVHVLTAETRTGRESGAVNALVGHDGIGVVCT